MERPGADYGKMTLNICKFRIFLLNLKGCYANIYPFQNWKGSLYCGHPFGASCENHIAGFGVGIHPNKDSPIVSVCGHRTILAL